MSKQKRITLSMPNAFIKKLEEVSKTKNLSRSEWVRRKIDEEYKTLKRLNGEKVF